LGFSYLSSVILADGSPAPRPANPVRDYIPSGQPGAQVFHCWLRQNRRVIST
jgi:hypothetical protein